MISHHARMDLRIENSAAGSIPNLTQISIFGCAQLHLCSHATATGFHVEHFKGQKCLDEWPKIDEDGVLHIGATGTRTPADKLCF